MFHSVFATRKPSAMNPSFSIEDVQAEALRLIDLQSSLLEQIRCSKILQADSEIQSTIDNRQSTIDNRQSTIDNRQ